MIVPSSPAGAVPELEDPAAVAEAAMEVGIPATQQTQWAERLGQVRARHERE